jgi:flagellar protein FlaI
VERQAYPMTQIGWKITDSEKAGYKILDDYALTLQEDLIYADLINAYKASKAKNTPKSENKEIFHALLKKICLEQNSLMRLDRAQLIEKIAEMNLIGFGPLDLFLKDDLLEEVSVTGINCPIRVYKRNFGWLESNCEITSAQYAINLINKMAKLLGRRITSNSPMLNASLPDGSRLHATIPPINSNDVEITIRKFPDKPISFYELTQNGTISNEAAAFLWIASYADSSILFCGNTGSGKTTLLNAIFSFMPQDERIVIIEETPEIKIPHKHKVCLISNTSLGIGMAKLVHSSLRMRPDRVIIGEVRTNIELAALFDSIQAGQAKGSYATFHAQNSREAINRMVGLGINHADLCAIDLIVVIRRISILDEAIKERKEMRRIVEIAERDDAGLVNRFFEYDDKTDRLIFNERNFLKSKFAKKIAINYGKNPKELLELICRRKTILDSIVNNGQIDYMEFTLAIQRELF